LSDVPILTPDQRLRVFVSSALEELADERRAVARAVSALRLTPVMFESGTRPHPPRRLYRAYLAQSDIFIGLYWERYGWVAPDMRVSGVEDEFDLSGSLPRLLYVRAPAPDREPRLAELIARIAQQASYRTFRTPTELGRLVRDDLATLLSERFAAARSAPSSTARDQHRLPVATTSLVGRDDDVADVIALVEEAGARLVTLTGPPGIGKTRLALAVGERLHDRFDAGAVFVSLAGVTEPARAVAAIGRAVGADLAGTDSPLQAVIERLGDDRWLLILDNLEDVLGVAVDLNALLEGCPGVATLATSLTALRLRAEREYPVLPLPLPEDASAALADVASSPAVALFVDRARAVRPEFALAQDNAAAVAEICRRLEGVPLAIELAAARTRLLSPAVLLRRLAASLDAVGMGAVDMPERHQTLRATVEWSVSLLAEHERSFLEALAVFLGGWTVDAAAAVAALDEDTALELTEALARHSLISLDVTEQGSRARMLETIRAFVAERLAARPDAADVQRRHAEYYRGLVEQADRPVRRIGQSEWVERLLIEVGNTAAAVRWYLTNDRAPLPHLFRVLALFWALRDPIEDRRIWIGELLPDADSLDPRPRAELLWTAAMYALEAGEDREAVAYVERLTRVLDEIDDRYLEAVSHVVLAWAAPLVDNRAEALREASVAVEQLRSQDEPFWTALALVTSGALEGGAGRYEEALRRLREGGELAQRFDSAWLAALARAELGIVAVMQGRFDDAWALLDEALTLSQAAQNTHMLTLCLDAFARLAFAAGSAEPAARLAGAAEGLRQRGGMRTWPMMRYLESEVAAEGREALGAERFDQAFAAGLPLMQREAVAEARALRETAAREPRR
jgi:predicted ATPase